MWPFRRNPKATHHAMVKRISTEKKKTNNTVCLFYTLTNFTNIGTFFLCFKCLTVRLKNGTRGKRFHKVVYGLPKSPSSQEKVSAYTGVS